MADGRTRWNGPARREERSFQAVTGASTNAPSVGGEARPRPRAGGWRSQGRTGGPRRRGAGGSAAPGAVPSTGCPAPEFWGPDAVDPSPADCDRDTPAPHGCFGSQGSLFFSFLSKIVSRNELRRLHAAVRVNFWERTSLGCLTAHGLPGVGKAVCPAGDCSLISPRPSTCPTPPSAARTCCGLSDAPSCSLGGSNFCSRNRPLLPIL